MPIGRRGFALLNGGLILRRIYKGRHSTKQALPLNESSVKLAFTKWLLMWIKPFGTGAERMVNVIST
jgi:hypothetical protein